MTATRFASHYFAAAFGEAEPAQADMIALGLLAGWEVPGMIRAATFSSGFVPHTLYAGRWLSSALEMPLGRPDALRARDRAGGFVIEAASLDQVEFAAEVLRQSTLHLDIGVTHHKPPGAPGRSSPSS